jgi:hypothetical protein
VAGPHLWRVGLSGAVWRRRRQRLAVHAGRGSGTRARARVCLGTYC